MECYSYTRHQTVLVSNGEWKIDSCEKKFDPLSHSSQNHLFIFCWNEFAFGILLHSSRIGRWNTKITVWHLTVLVSDGEWKNWIMSERLTTCHILARIIFSFSAGMNLPQNVLQSSPIGQQNAKICTPYLTVLVFNCERKTESCQKHWLFITF